LVAGERAAGYGQGGAAEVVDGAADAAAEEGTAAAGQRLVAAEGAVGDGGVALVEQATTEDVHRVGGGDSLVTGQGILIEGQDGTGLVEDAAAAETGDRGAGLVVPGYAAVGDGQAGQGHGRAVADVEDPAGGIPADGQGAGAGASDGQVL